MPPHRRPSSLALPLLVSTLAGCSKRETPAPDPAANAAPLIATASATASAPTTATAAPVAATEVKEVHIPLPNEGEVVYLHIKHPKARVGDILNPDFKAKADEQVSRAKASPEPGMLFFSSCKGDFPTEDVLWEHCNNGSFRPGARCSWSIMKSRAWSLAGAEPRRLELKAEMRGDWTAVVDESCQEQFGHSKNPWTTFDAMSFTNDDWRPEKDGLVLSAPQLGSCDPDRKQECKVPWDRLASFVKPGSPLKPIADKAPPGPKLLRLEERETPPPPEDPGGGLGSLPDELAPAQSACGKGDSRACVKVAEALYNGRGVNADPRMAQWMFWKACEAGEPTGCVNLGWAYLNDPQSTNAGGSAAPYFGKACTGGVVIGCLGLGTIYRDGRGTPKNPARAAELFKKACDGGVKAACSMTKP